MCADVAGVDRFIVQGSVGTRPGAGPTEKLSSVTAGAPKAVKPIVWPNVAEEFMVGKKPWLINLQHGCLASLYCLMRQRGVAAFAGVAALSWGDFHTGVMPRGPMGDIDANEDAGRHER